MLLRSHTGVSRHTFGDPPCQTTEVIITFCSYHSNSSYTPGTIRTLAQSKHPPKSIKLEVIQKVTEHYTCHFVLILCSYCSNVTMKATVALRCTQISYVVQPIVSGNANKTYGTVPEY